MREQIDPAPQPRTFADPKSGIEFPESPVWAWQRATFGPYLRGLRDGAATWKPPTFKDYLVRAAAPAPVSPSVPVSPSATAPKPPKMDMPGPDPPELGKIAFPGSRKTVSPSPSLPTFKDFMAKPHKKPDEAKTPKKSEDPRKRLERKKRAVKTKRPQQAITTAAPPKPYAPPRPFGRSATR